MEDKDKDEVQEDRLKMLQRFTDLQAKLTLELVDATDEDTRKRLRENVEEVKSAKASLSELLKFDEFRKVTPIMNTEKVGFQYFAKRLLEVAMSQSMNQEVFDFDRYWWDSREGTLCKKLFVRESYKTLFEKMKKHREEMPSNAGIFVLSGTPGTGKSGFGLYSVIRLIKEKHLVWYKMKTSGSVVFVMSEEGKMQLEQAFPSRQYNVGEVYAIKEEEESALVSIKNMIRVHDPEAGRPVPVQGLFYDIIVSSPDTAKLGEVEKSAFHVKYFCPLWTIEELKKVAEFHGVLEIDVPYRYSWCGGIPRLLFRNDYRDVIRQNCERVKFDDLRAYFDTGYKGALPMQILHLVPKDDMSSFGYKFGSKEITQAMVRKADRLSRSDVDWFVRGCQDMPFIQALRGEILEKRWHASLSEGGTFEGLLLGTTKRNAKRDVATTRVSITIPKLEVRSFMTLDDISSLDVNCYYQPKYRSFPTFDSFAVLHSSALGGRDNSVSVVCFQMTVARQHDLDVSGFREVQNLIDKRIPHIQMKVVFVSEIGKLDTVQPIMESKTVAPKEAGCWNVVQYVLHMTSTVDILKDLYPS